MYCSFEDRKVQNYLENRQSGKIRIAWRVCRYLSLLILLLTFCNKASKQFVAAAAGRLKPSNEAVYWQQVS